MTPGESIDVLTEAIIGAAIRVHKKWGPGLLHSVYLLCLAQDLIERDIAVEVEKPVALNDGSLRFSCAFRADLVVDGRVIVEVKTVKTITDVDVAQLLTYLRLMNIRIGLIINFNVAVLRHGIRRVANGHVDERERLV